MKREIVELIAGKYKGMIYRIALNYLRSPHDAEDIVQDVFFKLCQSTKVFESEEHLRYWLIRVTINASKNVLRLPWRKNDEYTDALASHAFENPEQSALFAAAMGLSDKYRVPLYLFYYEDLPVREIAKLLGIAESAVTTRLSRARGQLKSVIGEEWKNGYERII